MYIKILYLIIELRESKKYISLIFYNRFKKIIIIGIIDNKKNEHNFISIFLLVTV